jgi:hypothetical protein
MDKKRDPCCEYVRCKMDYLQLAACRLQDLRILEVFRSERMLWASTW